jgi:PKD repeat protein
VKKLKNIISFLMLLFFINTEAQIKLIEPRNYVTISKNKIFFHWDFGQISSIDTFKLSISEFSDFNSNIIQFKTQNDTTSIALPQDKKYFWKVEKNGITSSVYNQFNVIDPLNIDSLVLWVNTDSINLSIGSKISSWQDLSNNHYNLYQNISSKQPQILTGDNYINNTKIITFDGLDDYLQTNIPNLKQPLNYFLHIRNNNTASTDIFDGFNPYSNLLRMNNGLYGFYAGIGYIYSIAQNNDFKFKILNIEANSINSKFFTNGILENSSDPGANNPDGFTIGANGAISNFTNLDVNEIIIIKKTISDSLRAVISDYIMDKYAPPVSLGSNIVTQETFCNTVLSANNNYVSYLWSTNQTSSSISINQSGIYWVRVTDIYGRISSDTIQVQLNRPNLFQINETFLCENEIKIWNSQLSNQLFNFQWSDGSIDSLLIISQPGDYFVTVSDLFGCSITSDTITITQDNFSTTASLGQDTSLCSGNRITLTTGNQTGLTYLWNDNSTDSALVITNSGQYILEVTNQNNCVAKDTINVTISGLAPVAGFKNTATCLNSAIQFTDTSRIIDGSNLVEWFWDFGNTSTLADTSDLINPTYSYADTGTYQITLRVKSTQGCSQSIQKNIRVYPKPIVDYFSSIACQNDTTSFFSTINSLGYPINTFAWNFGDTSSGGNNQSSLSNSTHIFSQTGNFQVKLIAENNKQCKDSIIKSISVKNEVSADFNYSTACVGNPISFTDNSIVPAPNAQNVRLWNFYPGSAGGLSVNKTYPSAGTYSVSLTVNGYNGCISSITKNIEVYLPPLANFASDTICKNDTVLFQDLSLPQQGNLSNWQWKLNNQLISQIQQPTYVFNSSGNYNLQLITQNSFGCIDSISKNITVYSLPNATISSNADPYYFIDEPIQFNTSSSNFSFYFWVIDSLYTFNVAQPTFTFNTSGDYPVQLTIKDSLGCSSVGNKLVSVTSRILDLSVQQALASIDTFGFVQVTAELSNLGTSPITAFDIMYEITGTEKVKESWVGIFPPNSILQFTFNREVYLEEYKQKNALNCIRILSVNSRQDANLNNNQNCSSLISTNNFVYDPYPNPGNNKITIPVFLTETQSLKVEVIDMLGKTIFKEKTNGIKGVNLVQLQTEKWESGIYFLNIEIDETEFFQKKLIKN